MQLKGHLDFYSYTMPGDKHIICCRSWPRYSKPQQGSKMWRVQQAAKDTTAMYKTGEGAWWGFNQWLYRNVQEAYLDHYRWAMQGIAYKLGHCPSTISNIRLVEETPGVSFKIQLKAKYPGTVGIGYFKDYFGDGIIQIARQITTEIAICRKRSRRETHDDLDYGGLSTNYARLWIIPIGTWIGFGYDAFSIMLPARAYCGPIWSDDLLLYLKTHP